LNDQEYLETYEPVLRFARSERFFPMDVERYLEHCQIFPSGPQGVLELVTHLKNEPLSKRLGGLKSEQFYLRFVNNPLSDADAWVWWGLLSALGGVAAWFMAGWRGEGIALTAAILAALIIFMLASPIRLRIIPAIFSVLLFGVLEVLPIWFFLRPHTYLSRQMEYLVLLPAYLLLLFYFSVRTLKFILDRIVPEGPGLIMDMLSQATEQIAQEAYTLYAKILEKEPQPVYYGRVVHETGADGNAWTVLQYHFFYAFNDWRLAAHGMNHHEGDWETVAVYLQGENPHSVLFSQHGAGYMRRWESVRKTVDSEGRSGTHPLVYVALGSHANYSQPEIIRSASLYQSGLMQRFIYWVDGLIHFIFLLFNPSQQARQIALNELASRSGGLLSEGAFSELRDEADHYLISLPMEIASGDGFRAGPAGDGLREGVVMSSSFLKRASSHRPVERPRNNEWHRIPLNPEPEWVQYKGLWGVKSLLENESGPPGPKWDRPVNSRVPEVRMRWGRPLEWLKILEISGHD
jgi:hypothetical protein